MSNLFEELSQEIAQQKSKPWHDIRLGRFTSSQFWKLTVEPRSKKDKEAGILSATAQTYIMEKVAEELTGAPKMITAPAIEWGEDHEEEARVKLSELLDADIAPAVFVPHGKHSGGTPDGYIWEEGLIEIKCPYNTENHITNLLLKDGNDLLNEHRDYWWQVQCNMYFTGKSQSLFVSYDPRLEPPIDLKIIEVPFDESLVDLIEQKVEQAANLKQEIIEKITL